MPPPASEFLFLSGLCILSDIPLPELWRWPGASSDPVRIRLGCAQPIPGKLVYPGLTVDPDTGAALLEIPDVARFSVPSPWQVTVEPLGPTPPDSVVLRNFLYGTVLAILCFRHGRIPLHGAALRIGDGAIMLSGPSGAGKSTLASTLARRGHPLLSDDVCALLMQKNEPWLLPSFARLKLTPESSAAVGIDSAPGALVYGKQHIGLSSAHTMPPPPQPLRVVCRLAHTAGPTTEVSFRPLRGAAALMFLHSQVFRPAIGRALGLDTWVFESIARLAQVCSVSELYRPRDLALLEKSADVLESGLGTQLSGELREIALGV